MIDGVKRAYEVLDVRIAAITMKEAVALCGDMAETNTPHLIFTANAEMLMLARRHEGLATCLAEADLVVADGAGILWAGDVLGTPFPERVTGADLAKALLSMAAERGWPVYFLGGAPGVAQKAAEHIASSHPGFQIAGTHDGFFDAAEEKKILQSIREKETKILLVGMGVPKQEMWLLQHKEELGGVVAMGVGGVFDIMAGNLKRAPLWMQKHRLEWAYRLWQQPSRIGRMTALPRYMMAVKKWKQERNRVPRA